MLSWSWDEYDDRGFFPYDPESRIGYPHPILFRHIPWPEGVITKDTKLPDMLLLLAIWSHINPTMARVMKRHVSPFPGLTRAEPNGIESEDRQLHPDSARSTGC